MQLFILNSLLKSRCVWNSSQTRPPLVRLFKIPPSLQSRRILQCNPRFFFRNNVIPPSWRLILPASWDKSNTDFMGEVPSSLTHHSSLSFFLDFSRWRLRSMYVWVSVKKCLLCKLDTTSCKQGVSLHILCSPLEEVQLLLMHLG